MDIANVASLAGVGICAVGLIATWRRNGREQVRRDIEQAKLLASRDTEIKAQIDHINGELTSPEYGLSALARGQGDFRTHCATVSTALAGRVSNTEKDIEEIKKR